ncbi:MAG: hypothetical protein ACTIKC_01950 [Psychrobacter sp.]
MTNAKLFKQAHALTKATIKAGDDYRATFGACLKVIKDEAKPAAKVKAAAKAIYNVVTDIDIMLFVALVFGFIMLCVGFKTVNDTTNEYRQQAQYAETIEQAASYNYLNRYNQ